jgi:hypothetical protein
VWVGSIWYRVAYFSSSGIVSGVSGGSLLVRQFSSAPGPSQGWYLKRGSPRVVLWIDFGPDTTGLFFVLIPLWLPLLLTLIPTTIAWRLDARARRLAILGRCTQCSYDLAGLPADAPCPECGRVLAARRL